MSFVMPIYSSSFRSVVLQAGGYWGEQSNTVSHNAPTQVGKSSA
jgi:hypothetical protein